MKILRNREKRLLFTFVLFLFCNLFIGGCTMKQTDYYYSLSWRIVLDLLPQRWITARWSRTFQTLYRLQAFTYTFYSLLNIIKQIPYMVCHMKSNCSNLYFLSTIACQLPECLSTNELEILSFDLTTLGYMIESLLAHQSPCEEK